jgi:hypothetical protein
MKKIVRISEYFDLEDENIVYTVWMLNSSYLVTSELGPILEFETLEEAENYAENLVSC